VQFVRKDFISLIAATLFMICAFALLISPAKAYVLFGGSWSDANSLTYWLDSSISQAGYTSHSQHGSTAWNSSPHVEISSTSSSSGADIKWYASFNDLGDIYADALNYSGATACWNCSYTNSIIRWNQPFIEDTGLDSNRIKETATHEVGHSLGLDHEDTITSIMLSAGWLYGTYPVQDDFDGINAIYK